MRTRHLPVPLLAVLFAVLLAGGLGAQEFEVPDTAGTRWFKGNTHAHTSRTSGDSSPEEVARWYRDHGYDFLVISEHDLFVDPRELSGLAGGGFLLIGGEEISPRFGSAYAHVNGLGIAGAIAKRTEGTYAGTFQAGIDAVRAAGGVPQVNHPALNSPDAAGLLLQLKDFPLFEIHNGGLSLGSQVPERAWDEVLTAGRRVYGVASDDAHVFRQFSSSRQNPGRGWVVVRARRLEAGEIVRCLEEGRFYSSTGIELEDVRIGPRRIEVVIRPEPGRTYRTDFIGAGGRIVLRTESNPAVYDLAAEDVYVRAVVTDFSAHLAWVQPVFVRR